MKQNLTLALQVLTLIALGVFAGLWWNARQAASSADDASWLKDQAATLAQHGLYEQAFETYRRYIDEAHPPEGYRANIHYTAGKLAMDELHDCGRALEQFYAAEKWGLAGEALREMNKRRIQCLEQRGNVVDARRALDAATNVKPEAEPDNTAVVATYGDVKLTAGQLAAALKQLPPKVQEQFSGNEGLKKFLEQYTATELLVRAAKRQGLEDDPEIEQQVSQFRRSMLVERLVRKQLPDAPTVSPDEMRGYYENHPEEFADEDGKTKPFEDVQQEVYRALAAQRQEKSFNDLMAQLRRDENLKLYPGALGE